MRYRNVLFRGSPMVADKEKIGVKMGHLTTMLATALTAALMFSCRGETNPVIATGSSGLPAGNTVSTNPQSNNVTTGTGSNTTTGTGSNTTTGTGSNTTTGTGTTPIGTSDLCAGGTASSTPANQAGTVDGTGNVSFNIPMTNSIVAVQTTMAVPPQPPAQGTMFLWPGLQPTSGTNFEPIDNGVLQPVLTWGGTCAPHAPADPYAAWWISAQYVNTYGKHSGYTGCNGGVGMTVKVGDRLNISMTLQGTVWTQTVTSQSSGQSVKYTIDMQGQWQNVAEFIIEPYDNAQLTSDVEFTGTTITLASPLVSGCPLSRRGTSDQVGTVRFSSDGRICCIASIILKQH